MSSYPTLNADADSQAFWDAAADRRLVISRCDRCGRWVWLPSPVCPACSSAEISWVDVPATGRIASWIVVWPPLVPIFQPFAPFVVLLVEILPDLRLLGQLVDDAGTIMTTDGADVSLAIGGAVSLRWCDLDGQLIPTWTLATLS